MLALGAAVVVLAAVVMVALPLLLPCQRCC